MSDRYEAILREGNQAQIDNLEAKCRRYEAALRLCAQYLVGQSIPEEVKTVLTQVLGAAWGKGSAIAGTHQCQGDADPAFVTGREES